MKKSLFLLCLLVVTLFACEKDDLENKSNSLIGTWKVSTITPRNIDAQQLNAVIFNYGTYEFRRDNSFTYTSANRNVITGRWELNRSRDKNCDNCNRTYSYNMRLQSDAINHEPLQGSFSEFTIYKDEFNMSLYRPGLNSRFEYKFRKN